MAELAAALPWASSPHSHEHHLPGSRDPHPGGEGLGQPWHWGAQERWRTSPGTCHPPLWWRATILTVTQVVFSPWPPGSCSSPQQQGALFYRISWITLAGFSSHKTSRWVRVSIPIWAGQGGSIPFLPSCLHVHGAFPLHIRKNNHLPLHLCSCQWPRLGDKSCVMTLPFILSRNCLGLPLQKQQLSSGPPRHVGVILGIIWATLSTECPLQEIQVHGEVQTEPGTSEILPCKDVHLHIYTCGGSFTFPASFTHPFIPKHLPLPGKVVGLCRLFRSCQAFQKPSNARMKDDAGKGRNRKLFLSFLGCFFTQRSFIHWFISEHCACSGRMMYF